MIETVTLMVISMSFGNNCKFSIDFVNIVSKRAYNIEKKIKPRKSGKKITLKMTCLSYRSKIHANNGIEENRSQMLYSGMSSL